MKTRLCLPEVLSVWRCRVSFRCPAYWAEWARVMGTSSGFGGSGEALRIRRGACDLRRGQSGGQVGLCPSNHPSCMLSGGRRRVTRTTLSSCREEVLTATSPIPHRLARRRARQAASRCGSLPLSRGAPVVPVPSRELVRSTCVSILSSCSARRLAGVAAGRLG